MTAEDLLKQVAHLDPENRQRFLQKVAHEYEHELEDIGWLKVAESTFEFWDNPGDAAYDHYPSR